MFSSIPREEKRWRVISNVWGDELIPIAKALKNTGNTKITYIGTAGALPESGLNVGDLMIPKAAATTSGNIVPLKAPGIEVPNAKLGGTVAHVGSPFEETHSWLKAQTGKTQAVELEVAYLAEIFNSPEDKLQVNLLISDVVGSENETLADAVSSSRKNALDDVMGAIFKDSDFASPVEGKFAAHAAKAGAYSYVADVESNIEKHAGSRSAVAKYQLRQLALKNRANTEEKVIALIKSQKAFNENMLSTSIESAGKALNKLNSAFVLQGAFTIGVSKSFTDGTWNPATNKLEIILHPNASLTTANEAALTKYLAENSEADFMKSLDVKIIRGPPDLKLETVLLNNTKLNSGSLIDLYNKSALENYGLVANYGINANLTYARVPLDAAQIEAAEKEAGRNSVHFFDQSTDLERAQRLFPEIQDGKAFLEGHLGNLSSSSFDTALSVVPSLANGKQTEISVIATPEGKFVVNLKITEKALKNPALIADTLTEIALIKAAKSGTRSKGHAGYLSAEHWLETYWNAQEGSTAAKLDLLTHRNTALEKEVFALYFPSTTDPIRIQSYYKQKESQRADELKELTANLAQEKKAKALRWSEGDALRIAMEKDPVTLEKLIAANDRAGVRKLIDLYLPWQDMDSVETKAWKQWLEAIEHPKVDANTPILFRGLGAEDTLYPAKNGGSYLMSPMLTKNQGNFTRRLRSYRAKRDIIGSTLGYDGKLTAGDPYPNLTGMMITHAREPKGTPFLSFSNFDVAKNFGKNAIVAVRVDPRRAFANSVSSFNEAEVLVPQIIFPDEIIAIENTNGVDSEELKKKMIAEVEQKIGRPLKPDELAKAVGAKEFNAKYFSEFGKSFAPSSDFNPELIVKKTAASSALESPKIDDASSCKTSYSKLVKVAAVGIGLPAAAGAAYTVYSQGKSEKYGEILKRKTPLADGPFAEQCKKSSGVYKDYTCFCGTQKTGFNPKYQECLLVK